MLKSAIFRCPSPWQSCLNASHTSSKNISKLLKLLLISNKYCALILENQAREGVDILRVTAGFNPDTFFRPYPSIDRFHEPSSLTQRIDEAETLTIFDALEIASIAKYEPLRTQLQQHVLANIWTQTIPRYVAYCVGNDIGDSAILVAASYLLMLDVNPDMSSMPRIGQQTWEFLSDASNSFSHKWNSALEENLAGFEDYVLSENIKKVWNSHNAQVEPTYLALLWKRYLALRTDAFDLLGRISVAREVASVAMVCGARRQSSSSGRRCCLREYGGFFNKLEDEFLEWSIDTLGFSSAKEDDPMLLPSLIASRRLLLEHDEEEEEEEED